MGKKMDLSCLDTVSACEAGTEIELKHPVTGAGLDVFVTVIGKDAQAVRDYNKSLGDEYLRRQSVARKRGKEDEVQTMNKFEDAAIEFLTVCTTGWRWGDKAVFPLQKSGKPLEELTFNVANAKRVFTELPEVRKQMDEAIADISNFIKL